jgi:hypothetical protein
MRWSACFRMKKKNLILFLKGSLNKDPRPRKFPDKTVRDVYAGNYLKDNDQYIL